MEMLGLKRARTKALAVKGKFTNTGLKTGRYNCEDRIIAHTLVS